MQLLLGRTIGIFGVLLLMKVFIIVIGNNYGAKKVKDAFRIENISFEDIDTKSTHISRVIQSRFFRLSNFFNSAKFSNENDVKIVHSSIKFKYYINGVLSHVSSGLMPETLVNTKCESNDKFSFILHGWKQSCETAWVLKLIDRLEYYRGGCIVCIDYGVWANSSYLWLFRNFRLITGIITDKLKNLINEGIDLNIGFIFGFSYGGQLASSIGISLSPKYVFHQIDTCDMAGPGFDLNLFVNHRKAGQNVKCLHSSLDKGTHIYACHQNVLLGNCGHNQLAAYTQPFYSSHGLCVQIYINSFDYPFYAVQSKVNNDTIRNACSHHIFSIGFKGETNNSNPLGIIFVPTGLNFPYNLSEKEVQTFGCMKKC